MKIAIVGTGFVADLYLATRAMHPRVEVAGVYDRDAARLRQFATFHGVKAYESLEQVLDDASVQIVVNLTNPRSHYEISKAALDAGKHVYSEKPLALSYEEALDLVERAEAKGLRLAGAPATLLGETAQTMWKAVREGVPGRVRLVNAEMDEGLLHRYAYRKWHSASGAPWPAKDEFETGCTLEHAGYCLTWLCAFFGPARSVTAFSAALVDDKQTDMTLDPDDTPDYSVACVTFANGVVARMTNSIVAPHDHHLRIIGDRGVLYTPESWSIRSKVYFRKWLTIRRKSMLSPLPRKLALLRGPLPWPRSGGAQVIDFLRGVDELAESIEQDRACRLNGRFALHVTELTLATQYAGKSSCTHEVKSTFDPIEPMPWATHEAPVGGVAR